jgi:hypothetical protein
VVSRADLVEAQSYERRRLVEALLGGTSPGGGPERPGPRVVGGLALAGLVLAGAAVVGYLDGGTEGDQPDPAPGSGDVRGRAP